MPDPFAKAVPGQPMRIAAASWNAAMEAAQAHARGKLSQQVQSRATGRQVLIRNDSGEDREQFEVLEIGDVLINPDENEPAFLQKLAFAGVAPTAAGKPFAILQEPAVAGRIVPAAVAEASIVRLQVNDEDDTCAELEADACTLKTAASGQAQILWKQPGTGEKWGVVRFGGGVAAGLFPVRLEMDGGTNGTASSPPSWTYQVYDLNSGLVLASRVSPVFRRPNGEHMHAVRGIASYSDNKLVLWQVDEIPATVECAYT